MWFLTVSVLRWSSAAICFVERPCSRRRSTSTWRGVRCGGGVPRLSSGRPLDQSKDADHRFTVLERHRAHLHGHPVPSARDEVAGRFAGHGGAEHLLNESLAGAGPFLGCYEGGEVATTNVAEEPLGRGIDPPNDSRLIKDIAGDTHVLQGLLDVAADLQASGHRWSVTDPRWQPTQGLRATGPNGQTKKELR